METLHDTSASTAPITKPAFRFTFGPFLTYLKGQQHTSAGNLSGLYAYLIRRFERLPVYSHSPREVLGATQLAELFDLVSITVLPLVSEKQNLPYAFGSPVPLELLHVSPAFERLMSDFPDLLDEMASQTHDEDRLRFIYRLVLERCYHIDNLPPVQSSFRFHKTIYGLTKYFQIDLNTTFVAPQFDGELPPLQPAWVDFVRGAKLPKVVPPLPVEIIQFEGFSFFTIEDITEAETIRQLREVFTHLHSDTEAVIYDRFETAFRNLCGQPDLHISILPLPQVNGAFVYHPDLKKRSLFLRHSGISDNTYHDPVAQQNARDFFATATPHLFPNLTGMTDPEWRSLYEKGVRSFLLYPIATANEVLGVLEMGSTQPNALDERILDRIDGIMPLVQELLRYQMNQFTDGLEQLVKQKFTSLQPAVAWKFYEAAWEDYRLGNTVSTPAGGTPVRFPGLFPLYGAVDVRDSSAERQRAIRQDMTDQMDAVILLLSRRSIPHEPMTRQVLLTGCHDWQQRLTDNPARAPEAVLFLRHHVHPYLRGTAPTRNVKSPVAAYFSQVNEQTGRFTQGQTRYEQSMDRINITVNRFVDQQKKQLQTVYPHYFDRQRTDGTDYTLYVGQSIAPQKPFDAGIREQFCRWQLMATVEMARLTHELLPTLPLPMRTTQLILAYGSPVDISFRKDERRFDVEGSQSIRHEVLKKRIDKALIVTTRERLTQPDTIALVFSHTDELAPFLPVVTELQRAGKVRACLEYVDLEPLQGVANLKALRIQLRYADGEEEAAA